MRQTVRVAILSDTHGELDRRIARAIAGCDRVAHAGDLGSPAVASLLQPRSGECTIVRGNNDVPGKWPAGQRSYLDALPLEATLDLPGGQLQIVHGDKAGGVATRHATLRKRYPGARAVVYGHSHRLAIDDEEKPWILNPGAAGVSRTFGGPSLLILSASARGWRVKSVRYELPAQRSFMVAD